MVILAVLVPMGVLAGRIGDGRADRATIADSVFGAQRHTYATLASHLAGARPGYVARQLGHANTGASGKQTFVGGEADLAPVF
jgi:hypothetical protein